MSDLIPPPPSSGHTVAYRELVQAHDACYCHVLQLARVVQKLVADGYGDEALPLSRVMISTAFNLGFIASSGNAGGWGLRYWIGLADQEIDTLRRQLKRGVIEADAIRHPLADSRANLKGLKAAAKQEGITIPDKLIPPGEERPGPTWTGLSERAIAKRLNQLDWYDVEYSYASSLAHARALAIKPIADGLMAGRLPTIGPHYRNPLATLAFSGNVLGYATETFQAFFGLEDTQQEVGDAATKWSAAIAKFREDSGTNAMVAALLPITPAQPQAEL